MPESLTLMLPSGDGVLETANRGEMNQRTLFDPEPVPEPGKPLRNPRVSLVRRMLARMPEASPGELWTGANEFERFVLCDTGELLRCLREMKEQDMGNLFGDSKPEKPAPLSHKAVAILERLQQGRAPIVSLAPLAHDWRKRVLELVRAGYDVRVVDGAGATAVYALILENTNWRRGKTGMYRECRECTRVRCRNNQRVKRARNES